MKLTKETFRKCLELFLVFFKIGAFTFGGGVAMIPFIEREVDEKRGWINKDELLDIVVVSESTPGPIAINAATFIGYKVAGFFGSFFATLGVVLPSFLIILLLSAVLEIIWDYQVVQFALRGMRAGVLALVIKALWSLFKKAPKDVFSWIMMLLSFVCIVVFDLKVLIVIISGALLGLAVFFISKKAGEKK